MRLPDTGQHNTIVITAVDLPALGRLAQAMVDRFQCPLVIGLVGTLGAGKTTFVQSVARAAAIDAADVTSPTFTLLQTHHGKLKLHHLDAYRISDEDEFLELGVEELFEEGQSGEGTPTWTLVEWADRFPDCLPPEMLWVGIDLETTETNESENETSSNPSAAHTSQTGANQLRRVTLRSSDEHIARRLHDVARDMRSRESPSSPHSD